MLALGISNSNTYRLNDGSKVQKFFETKKEKYDIFSIFCLIQKRSFSSPKTIKLKEALPIGQRQKNWGKK